MILIDTSVWVDHLRFGDRALEQVLEAGQAATHPFVIGELALGNLRQRREVLGAITELPRVNAASDAEVLHFIEELALFGSGIGYIDAHLLASLRLTPGARIWTRDRRLDDVSKRLGLAAETCPDDIKVQR